MRLPPVMGLVRVLRNDTRYWRSSDGRIEPWSLLWNCSPREDDVVECVVLVADGTRCVGIAHVGITGNRVPFAPPVHRVDVDSIRRRETWFDRIPSSEAQTARDTTVFRGLPTVAMMSLYYRLRFEYDPDSPM